MVMPLAGGNAQVVAADLVPADFPTTQLVTPRAVTYQAEDGVVVHAQLFDSNVRFSQTVDLVRRVLPRIGQFIDRERNFTLGYICTARKPS